MYLVSGQLPPGHLPPVSWVEIRVGVELEPGGYVTSSKCLGGKCPKPSSCTKVLNFVPKLIKLIYKFYQKFLGAVVVPAAAAGHLFGGFLISKFKWKTSQIIVYTMVCCLVGAGLTPSMLSYCNDIPVAGVTVSYV